MQWKSAVDYSRFLGATIGAVTTLAGSEQCRSAAPPMKNGKAVFDCEDNDGGKNLVQDCIRGIGVPDVFKVLRLCQNMISEYQSSPD